MDFFKLFLFIYLTYELIRFIFFKNMFLNKFYNMFYNFYNMFVKICLNIIYLFKDEKNLLNELKD